MNKKAEISIVILVIGTLAVFLLSFINFFLTIPSFSNSFDVIQQVQGFNSKVEQYNFYKDTNYLGYSGKKLEKIFNVSEDLNGKYLYLEKKVRNHWYSFKKNKIMFSIKIPVK